MATEEDLKSFVAVRDTAVLKGLVVEDVVSVLIVDDLDTVFERELLCFDANAAFGKHRKILRIKIIDLNIKPPLKK